jgi:mono/diheme cytochrome c family protein
MFRHFAVITAAAALLLATGYANETKGKVTTIPVQRVNATDGKLMYANYCAPCHGADGRGNGPMAGALKSQPTDLTAMAKMNNGKYPDTHVAAVLRFGASQPSHGTSQMPVWGPLLGKMDNVRTQDAQLRIANLSRYLHSIQVK